MWRVEGETGEVYPSAPVVRGVEARGGRMGLTAPRTASADEAIFLAAFPGYDITIQYAVDRDVREVIIMKTVGGVVHGRKVAFSGMEWWSHYKGASTEQVLVRVAEGVRELERYIKEMEEKK